MALCVCTPAQMLEHRGHMPGCRFHVVAPPAAPLERKTYTPPTITPIEEGSERWPLVHALALLVRARTRLRLRAQDGSATLEEGELSQQITVFVDTPVPAGTIPMPPPTPPTADLPPDEEDVPLFVDDRPAPLEAFARMPGSAAGERLQSGPVMPTPAPAEPGFTWPTPRRTFSPPYSHGCAHPAQRLQPNGRGVTCLDCSTDFPGFMLTTSL